MIPSRHSRLKSGVLAAVIGLSVLFSCGLLRAENLLSVHDPTSVGYDGDCLKCHSEVLQEKTKDPRIPSFHQAMLPFTPGYNPTVGATNNTCIACHQYIDIDMDSGGALRKHVDPMLCALCHGPAGPAPVYYTR